MKIDILVPAKRNQIKLIIPINVLEKLAGNPSQITVHSNAHESAIVCI